MKEALKALKAHIKACKADKYEDGGLDFNLTQTELSKGFNGLNAVKYIVRYLAVRGNKTGNPEDLLKAAHFILLELKRINKDGKCT